jgi:glycosyltransferase involved in cell wall biosynthesis
MKKFVSVIIPVFRDWYTLNNCLSALSKQTYNLNDFEIIIVNNDPNEQVPDYMRLTSNNIVVVEEKPGSYAARNKGLTIARGEIIGFTDSDCIPDKDWIKNAVSFLNENKSFSRVAGPVQIILKSTQPTIIEKYNQLFAFPQTWLINNGGGSVTANLFVYKSVFEDIGGFDDTLMSMGDKFWGMKAEAAGYKIAYDERVIVYHPPRTLSELIKKEKRHGGVVTNLNQDNKLNYFLDYLFEFRPRLTGIKYMLGRRKRLKDRIIIPLLRHFLILIRARERLKVQFGKKANRI